MCSGKYLNLSLLKSGDVILTFPKGRFSLTWQSHAIRLVTHGLYSHAILVIAPTLWYESEDSGVGPTFVAVDRIESRKGEVRLLKCLDGIGEILVLRHPASAAVEEETLRSRLELATDDLSFRQYPLFTRIARDLNVVPYLPEPLRDSLLSLVDDNEFKELNRGLFCSEVIANVYAKLGPDFEFRGRQPKQVCPSDIANSAISGMSELVDEYEVDSDLEAATVEPGILRQIAAFATRERIVGEPTRLRTLLAAAEQIIKLLCEADGISPDQLTRAGFAKTLSDTFESMLEESYQQLQLIAAVGRRVIGEGGDAVPLSEGGKLLAETVDALRNNQVTFLKLARTYGEVMSPGATVDDTIRTGLEQGFIACERWRGTQLRLLGQLCDEFRIWVQEERTWSDMGSGFSAFIERMEALRAVLVAMGSTLESGWKLISPTSPLIVSDGSFDHNLE